MDYKTMLAVMLPLGLAAVAIFSTIGLAKSVIAAMEATARQPEAATKILINMATGLAFIEAITIYFLVFAFIVSGKI